MSDSLALGRRVPTDFNHVRKYAFAAPQTVDTVEKTLRLPWWHWTHDQGSEGACVGFGTSMMMVLLNMQQRKVQRYRPFTQRYDSWWLWDEAKRIDEWGDTNPGDSNGTSVRAACDVLRNLGHVQVKSTSNDRIPPPPQVKSDLGVLENRWAQSADEMRTALAAGIPISIGVNWYRAFDAVGIRERVIGNKSFKLIGTDMSGSLGRLRGGHCVCIYGASDKLQAFAMKNSWGKDYPLVWLPYDVMDRLIREDGEATLVTDR